MDIWTTNEEKIEEEHDPSPHRYREKTETKKTCDGGSILMCLICFYLVMFIFQFVNYFVGQECVCPFNENIPRILQVSGGFGAVLYLTFHYVTKYFKDWGICGYVCLVVLICDIIGYISCFIAAVIVSFRNFYAWYEEDHKSCDCFEYTFGMVITHFALFAIVFFYWIGIKCSSE